VCVRERERDPMTLYGICFSFPLYETKA
jgi:hypothetical protein